MPALTVRGLHNADTASVFSKDEVGTIDDTFLFPKWWDRKANNVEYIRCFKLRMERVCDDIDVIIPASHDVEIRGVYDGNVGFRFDFHRGVRRMALTAPDSTTVTAEYIFPTRPGQQPTYREYGPGPVSCFSATPLGSWKNFVIEHRPKLDLGDLSAADGFYDLNQEPFNGFNMGGLKTTVPSFTVNVEIIGGSNVAIGASTYVGATLGTNHGFAPDSDLLKFEWSLPAFCEWLPNSTHDAGEFGTKTGIFRATRRGIGFIGLTVTAREPLLTILENVNPDNPGSEVIAS